MGGVCSTHRKDENYIQSSGWKTKGTRKLGRPKRRWQYNIKTDVREIGWEGLDWIYLAQDREQ